MLGELLREDAYDVIHAHSHLFYSSNVAAIHSRFDETPLAVTCHGLNSQRVPGWVSETHLRTVGKWTYNAADTVFCYTPTERDRLHELGVTSEISVIKNGIDTRRFSPETGVAESDEGSAAEQISDTDGPTVLFVGRLVEGKCPSDVLEAFEQVQATYPETRLFFCGDGPLRTDLEAAAVERGIGEAVEFLSHVPYEEMPAVYSAADLLALGSRTEGVPRTVLEALACETPVVSTDLDQIVPIVEESGATVPVGDIDGFADAIVDILGRVDSQEPLGERGRTLVTAQYDWDRTVERTTAALASLAGSDRTDPAPTITADGSGEQP
jgi:glycosyltransferase involved in cell wall biosynthesis